MEAIAYLIGAGSMSLGIEAAGFNIKEVWETPGYSKNAKTWDINRPDRLHQVLELDHNNTNHFWTRTNAGQNTQLIYGNPPCGGLSSMTCSRIESPTNNCMRQWMRMVAPSNVPMILMENAYQLATPRCKVLLDDLTMVLEHYGYQWWTWMFYSYQIGCPQIRRRMFLCATKYQIVKPHLKELFDIPSATGRSGKKLSPCGPWLEDLRGIPPQRGLVTTHYGSVVDGHEYGRWKTEQYSDVIKSNWDRFANGFSTYKDLMGYYEKALTGDQSAIKDYKKWLPKYWAECPKDLGGMVMHRPYVVKWDEASHAVIGAFKYLHEMDRRFMTFRELMRFMGFPDHWRCHEVNPYLIAQGVPAHNSYWAAERMKKIVGIQ